jgi:hypothetical protein
MIGMRPVILSLLCVAAVAVALVTAQNPRRFTGTITDSMCPAGDHSQMRMGPTNAECTIGCNDGHGAPFVLYDGKDTYGLSDQKLPGKFAGKKVTVTGTLDVKIKTIQVTSIAAADTQ